LTWSIYLFENVDKVEKFVQFDIYALLVVFVISYKHSKKAEQMTDEIWLRNTNKCWKRDTPTCTSGETHFQKLIIIINNEK